MAETCRYGLIVMNRAVESSVLLPTIERIGAVLPVDPGAKTYTALLLAPMMFETYMFPAASNAMPRGLVRLVAAPEREDVAAVVPLAVNGHV